MCETLMEVDHTATDYGWWGWSEGPRHGDHLIYNCGCGGHMTIVAHDADDPEYYEKRCEFIRQCQT